MHSISGLGLLVFPFFFVSSFIRNYFEGPYLQGLLEYVSESRDRLFQILAASSFIWVLNSTKKPEIGK